MPRLRISCLSAAILLLLPAASSLAQTQMLANSVAVSGTVRNNYTGYVGMEFSFNASYQVSSLGRAYLPGNSGTHTVKLVNAANGVDVPGASVQITMTSNSNVFQFVALPSPVTLQPGTSYLLLSSETAGGDTWYDLQNVIASGPSYQNFSISGAVYSDAGGAYVEVPNTAGFSYVPPNLLYGTPSTSGATVIITSPVNGQSFDDETAATFSATVSGAGNPVSGSTLQFQLDGQNYGALLTTPAGATFSLSSNPSLLANGNHSLTAVYTAPGASPVSSAPVTFAVQGGISRFITTQNPGPLRNNFTGFVGMEFGISASPSPGTAFLVTSLGRYVWPGNTQTHVVKLFDATIGSDVPGGSVTVSTSGATAGQYAYTALPAPIVLTGDLYYLLSQETSGGDQWADYGQVTTDNSPVYAPVYQSGSSYVTVNLGSAFSYVPVNFLFTNISHTPPVVSVSSPVANAVLAGTVTVEATATTDSQFSQPLTIKSYQLQIDGQLVGRASSTGNISFDTTTVSNGSHTLAVQATDSYYLTGVSAPIPIFVNNSSTLTTETQFVTASQTASLRNNYSGYVGMQFTVAGASIQVAALERLCSAGNSGSHVIKLVQVSTDTDVAGTVTSVNMAGCTEGQYVAANLGSPVILPAGGSYYLVDEETSGGDAWHDYSPVTTTSVASVIGSVYSNSAGVFVPVPFASTSYVPLNFLYKTGGTPNPLTTSVTGFMPFSTITGTATSRYPVTSVQFQVDGFSITPPLTAAPYTQTLPFSLNLGNHVLSSIATDAAGNVATSAPFPINVQGYSPPSDYAYPLLVTGSAGALRNNYTGWVGFQFTQGGPLPIPGSSVSLPADSPWAMGTGCVAGNTQGHIVKIVRASDGVDLTSTWVNCALAGSAPGNQSWGLTSLPSAPLVPGQSYYLVVQETAGGDQFSDVAPATPYIGVLGGGIQTFYVSNFTIDGPVYFDGSKYVLVPNLPNYSYAEVYLLGALSVI